MEIISKTKNSKEVEYTLFGDFINELPNSEDKAKVFNQYLITYAKDKSTDLSPLFRSFLKYKFKAGFTSQSFSGDFGSEWKLKISLLEYNKNDETKILNIDHGEYRTYLSKGLVPQAKKVSKIIKDIERGKSKNPKSANSIFNLITSDGVIDLLASANNNSPQDFTKLISKKCKPEMVEKLLSGLQSGASDNILNVAESMLQTNHKEGKWQNFFFENKSYFFFGAHIASKEFPMNDSIAKTENKRFADILVTDQFGIPKIIELKRPDFTLFKWDNSHNKFVQSSELSSAISQTQNYLRAFAKNELNIATQAKIKKGYEPLVQGMIIFGQYSTLFKMTETLKKKKKKNNWTEEDLLEMALMELHTINYNQKNLSIITFDQFIKDSKKALIK